MVYFFIGAILLSLVITALILKKLIPVLKSKKIGQKILDIGPRWHISKEGTPTMGGLAFLLTALLLTAPILVLTAKYDGADKLPLAVITVLYALLNGLIGVIDDRAKLMKKQNEGLKAWQKYFLQLAVAALYLVAMNGFGYITTSLYIPFVHKTVELGAIYWFLAIILLTGAVNSVNLADGIDGLVGTETVIVGAFFATAGMLAGQASVSLISGMTVGICLGFLVYNFYPAKVFMGDTGSLFLGGIVVGLAFAANDPLIILIVGFMYMLESISVILQVAYFKITKGKRLFKMAPIHHHFEKCGWSEIKIVTVFGIITLILGAISVIFETLA